jgi:P27 family predicted phage terminase small subunit
MAHKGPRPQPTKLKLLKGNPGKRALNKSEPQTPVAPEIARPPVWLHELAKAEWEVVAPILHGLGLLTEADLTFFAAYCQSYARWREAEEWIGANKGGTIVLRDKDGKVRSVVRAPQAIAAQAALADMNRFGSQFGLSPSSRTSIGGAEPAKPENEFAKLGLVP